MRIVFSALQYRRDAYFALTDFHVAMNGIRCNEAQFDLYLDEVDVDFFEVWDPENTGKGEFHVRYSAVPAPGEKEKIRCVAWGGPVEGNTLSAESFESIQVVFLDALRDAETELKPGRSSKLASLLNTLTDTKDKQAQFTKILQRANHDLLNRPEVQQVEGIINKNLSTIEQDVMQQRIALGLVEPRFDAITGALRIWLRPRWIFVAKADSFYEQLRSIFSSDQWADNTDENEVGAYIDSFFLLSAVDTMAEETKTALLGMMNNPRELYQNGLGYNNILFMSAVLGDIASIKQDALFNLLLVEEPEAHLHPQLQELVHSFFEQNVTSESTQVFYTSHSPTLVSRIGIDRIILLFEVNHQIRSLSLSESNLSPDEKVDLERYLDVTKSQMLFAKGIIFVEGICEALLLPIFAALLGQSLEKHAIEVVNIDGTSFRPFANLLCYANDTSAVTIRASIISDDDRCTNKENASTYISRDSDYDFADIGSIVEKLAQGEASDRFKALDVLCKDKHIGVFGAPKTLEYALALESDNSSYLLNAISAVHPNVGPFLRARVEALSSKKEKAACIWLFMQHRPSSKGELAQALAREISVGIREKEKPKDDKKYSKLFVVPGYIKNAIEAVTIRGENNVRADS